MGFPCIPQNAGGVGDNILLHVRNKEEQWDLDIKIQENAVFFQSFGMHWYIALQYIQGHEATR